jgi:hypothetical protein
VSIVVKTKCVNSGNISDICDKHNFPTNYINCTTEDTCVIQKHTYLTMFYTRDGTVS